VNQSLMIEPEVLLWPSSRRQ